MLGLGCENMPRGRWVIGEGEHLFDGFFVVGAV